MMKIGIPVATPIFAPELRPEGDGPGVGKDPASASTGMAGLINDMACLIELFGLL